MFERFKKFVNKAIEKQNKNNLMEWPLEDVKGLFEIEDHNKWLKYNAMNEKQIENSLSFEKNINSLIKNLYVPSYQQENV